MRVTSGNANYMNALSMYNDLMSKNSKETDSTASKIAGNYASTGSQTTGSLLTSQGREELQKALNEMKKAGYTRFTFADVEDYRKQLEGQFTSAVKSDLTEMGVDPDIEFNLVLDANGKLSVISNHPDKAIVEQYFADNPEMVDVFKNIQALSNLKKAEQRSPQQAAEYTRTLKTSLQAEAVQAFFAATETNGADYFTQIAAFGSTGASYLLGLDKTV